MSRPTVHTSDTEKKLLAQPRCRDQFSPNTFFKLFLFLAQDAQAPALKPHPTQFQTQWSQFVRLDGSDLHKLRHTKSNVQATECSNTSPLSKPCSKNSPTWENSKNLCNHLFSGTQVCTAIPYNCWGHSAVIVLRNLLSPLNLKGPQSQQKCRIPDCSHSLLTLAHLLALFQVLQLVLSKTNTLQGLNQCPHKPVPAARHWCHELVPSPLYLPV